jgi:hypothetical protein
VLTLAASRSSRAAAILADLPGSIRCQEQSDLFAEVGGIAVLRQIRAVGAVDLMFVANGGWRLLVEIKINSGFGQRQRERYLASRQPLVVIVRDPAAAPPPTVNVALASNWLGAVAWSELSDTLEALPVESDRDRGLWRELLSIARNDGDFLTRKPTSVARAEAKKAEPMLSSALSVTLDAVRKALEDMGSRGQALAARLQVDPPRGGSDGWAGCAVHFGDPKQPRFWVAVKNASSPAPTARVWWYPPLGFRAGRRLGDAYERIQRHGFAIRPHDQFLREEPLPATLVRERGAEPMLAAFLTQSLLDALSAGAVRADL